MYAIKKVKMTAMTPKEKENSVNEVRLLASIDHLNVIKYYESFFEEESGCLYIVMEHADGGDLYKKITNHGKKSTFIKEGEIWRFFIQIVRGLKSMHDLSIFHRDLKSANVFMTKEGDMKLGDMNVSKIAKAGFLHTQTGTPYYASPEVWRDEPYDLKSDIWSLGCVLYELLTLKPPFRSEDMAGLYKSVVKGKYKKIPNNFSNEISEIVDMMLSTTPDKRPTCWEILKHPHVVRAANKYLLNDDENFFIELVETIKIPRNMIGLSAVLPRARYNLGA